MLQDSAPVLVLSHAAARANLDAVLDGMRNADGTGDQNEQARILSVPLLDLVADRHDWAIFPPTNPDPKAIGLTSKHLAYSSTPQVLPDSQKASWSNIKAW